MMEWHLLRPELLWLSFPGALGALLLRKQRQRGRWHELLDPMLPPTWSRASSALVAGADLPPYPGLAPGTGRRGLASNASPNR